MFPTGERIVAFPKGIIFGRLSSIHNRDIFNIGCANVNSLACGAAAIVRNDLGRRSNRYLYHAHNRGYYQKSSKGRLFDTEKPSVSLIKSTIVPIRKFQTVGEYHDIADRTLHSIQDGVEDFLEEHYASDDATDGNVDEDLPEVNYASGVLTIYTPPHGTYVINKQTPNEQIWLSSPISGPKRYEYDVKTKKWVNSRVVESSSADVSCCENYSEDDTLTGILNKEFEQLFRHEIIFADID